MVAHPGEPRGRIAAYGAIAVGIYRTPFRDEYGKTAVHGTHGVRTLVTGGVRARVKMERVSDILLGIRDLVANSIARVLIPTTAPHKNQVVRILTYGLDYRIGVILDGSPGLCRRFVKDLENDVIVPAPLLRHVTEELPCVIEVVGRLVAVVVDNHVDVVVDGRLHHRIHQALVVAFLGEIVAGTPVLVHAHRRTDYLDILILHEPVHDIGSPEWRAHVARDTPKEAHALHSDFVAVGNALAGTINLALVA